MAFTAVHTIVGRKRVPEVLSTICNDGPLRFTELEERIETSTDTLSQALDTLNSHGLVTREEITARQVSYTPTRRGRTVTELLTELEVVLSSGSNENGETD